MNQVFDTFLGNIFCIEAMEEFMEGASELFTEEQWCNMSKYEQLLAGKQYYIYYTCSFLGIEVVPPRIIPSSSAISIQLKYLCGKCGLTFFSEYDQILHGKKCCRERDDPCSKTEDNAQEQKYTSYVIALHDFYNKRPSSSKFSKSKRVKFSNPPFDQTKPPEERQKELHVEKKRIDLEENLLTRKEQELLLRTTEFKLDVSARAERIRKLIEKKEVLFDTFSVVQKILEKCFKDIESI